MRFTGTTESLREDSGDRQPTPRIQGSAAPGPCQGRFSKDMRMKGTAMLRETRTMQGLVRGTPAGDPRITAFKGIPFAAPPVGDLRFRAPQPPASWPGVRDCSRFAPISMQETPGLNSSAFYSKEWHVDPAIPMDEDCLYLNVWTPAKRPDEQLPVMVWIFGGGMVCGYTAEMEFDGERLARRGVVLVTVNYRLNSFGFLAHPELTAEAMAHGEVACNFGLLDQRCALLWVKDNIRSFGGDPESITIFGQSAGGRSTWAHICSPMNAGLFQRAIAQSGALAGDIAKYRPLQQAERDGEAFLAHLGVSSIQEARALEAEHILQKTLSWKGARWNPVIDGQFMVRNPAETIWLGEQMDVALMVGNTANEGPFAACASLQDIEAQAKRSWGSDDEGMSSLLKKKAKEEGIDAVKALPALNPFEVGKRFAAISWSRHKQAPVYIYRFNPPIPGDAAGSFHSSELWFVFETLAKCWRPFVGFHYDLARNMCNYWTNFAKHGNPNGKDADGSPMPHWPTAGEQGNRFMLFEKVPEGAEEEADDLMQLELARCIRNIQSGLTAACPGQTAD